MPLFYRKIQRANPLNRLLIKWYPVLKSIGVLRTKELSKLISDETKMNPKDAEWVLHELIKIFKRELQAGRTISIDNFGTFYLSAKATGEDTEEAVTAGNITGLHLRFRPDPGFKTEIDKVEVKHWQ